MNTEEKKKKPRFKFGVDLTTKVNLNHSSEVSDSTLKNLWLKVKEKLFVQKNQE
jgi:hypothetical protein